MHEQNDFYGWALGIRFCLAYIKLDFYKNEKKKIYGIFQCSKQITVTDVCQSRAIFFFFFCHKTQWELICIHLTNGVLSATWNFAPASKKYLRFSQSGWWMPCSFAAKFQKAAFALSIETVPLNKFQRKMSRIYWNGICGILDKAVRSNSIKSYLLILFSIFSLLRSIRDAFNCIRFDLSASAIFAILDDFCCLLWRDREFFDCEMLTGVE